MRSSLVLFALGCGLLAGCSHPDPQLQELSHEVAAKHAWQPPLPPTPFISDGCSGWPDYQWQECCVEHDAVYWMGGSRQTRQQADMALQECVSNKGYPLIGRLMYYGIRLGGVYWLPTPFRWGFGWPYPQSGPPGMAY